MDYALLDLTTIFKMLWKNIYDQMHDNLLSSKVEVYPVVCLSDTHLSVCVTWNSVRSGKMENSTFECPIDIHYAGNLLYIAYHLNQILLDTPLPDDNMMLNFVSNEHL